MGRPHSVERKINTQFKRIENLIRNADKKRSAKLQTLNPTGAERMPEASHVYKRYYICENSTPAESHLTFHESFSINIQIRWICIFKHVL